MNQGGGSETTTSEPWSGQKPYLQDMFSQAQQQFYGGGREYYPGQTYADMSDPTQQGLQATAQRAQGSPVEQGMQNYVTGAMGQQNIDPMALAANMGRTASGEYLAQGNPYLDQLGQQVTDAVMPGVNATFGGAGRTGSNIHADQLTGSLTKSLGANVYAPAYEAERGRMMQADQNLAGLYGDVGRQQYGAASLAPSAAGLDWQNIDRMMGAGQRIEQQNQMGINEDMARHDFYQNEPYDMLGRYAGIINQMPGGYGSTTSPGPQSGGVTGAIGGMTAGAGLADTMELENPYSAALTGGLGLLGYMG